MRLINKVIFSLLMIVILVITASAGATVPESAKDRKYGGINQGFDNPPEGTSINENLTVYYGCPVATGNNTYFHYGGFWFTVEEVKKLPDNTLRYGENPYSTDSKKSNDIKMPINIISLFIIISFIYIITQKK